jgi:phosphatidylglycerophosphate synthase
MLVAMDEPKADCYSANERAAMIWGQQLREWWLGSLLTTLVAWRISADFITALSLVSGLGFCACYAVSKSWAFLFLGLHVFFDGLDGPLARRSGVASRAGSFTDSTVDQIVVAASTATMMMGVSPPIDVVAGSYYVFVYTLVVVFAMVRNAMNVPYSWLVRPRFIVFAWFVVETWFWPGTINYVLWFFNVILTWKMLTGFRTIRSSL